MAQVEHYGTAPDGTPVQRIGISGGGLTVYLLTYGARVQDLRLDGIAHPLVLGSPDLAAYVGPMNYYGAIVGRVANRIAGAQAKLDGRVLTLTPNENDRTILHGGAKGCSAVNWQLDGYDASACRLTTRLPHGQAGFPANLDITADFRTPGEGRFEIELTAITDAPTFCNLAHHGYWCLDDTGDLRGHRLCVAADNYLPINDDLIPTGKPVPVERTPFDFRTLASFPDHGLLDHNFCLNGDGFRHVARLETETVKLAIKTTEPGLQVYDGALIDTAGFTGLTGVPYRPHAGVALEPQGWPDAPNNPDAPSVRLDPGDTYLQRTEFQFFG